MKKEREPWECKSLHEWIQMIIQNPHYENLCKNCSHPRKDHQFLVGGCFSCARTEQNEEDFKCFSFTGRCAFLTKKKRIQCQEDADGIRSPKDYPGMCLKHRTGLIFALKSDSTNE